ncbi:MAG: sulfite exporter TauE/SafE family protein [Gammaproteobacteria bacterium]|nr:sulfite exporter TauE/SafE family protein [Gammaproteobacteria bacterium]
MTGLEPLLMYLLLGAFAGLIAGLLGVGGGLIIVPTLIGIWQLQGLAPTFINSAGVDYMMQLAIGTSLASIVFTSMSSVYAHHRRGAVLWPVFWRLTSGSVVGAWLGSVLAVGVSGQELKFAFGIFELLVAAQMIMSFQNSSRRNLPSVAGLGLAGSVIGAMSALMGIGGGLLIVPLLTRCNIAAQKAVATSAACGLPIAVGGALGYVVSGLGRTDLPTWSAGMVYLPALGGIVLASVLFAPLGAALSHHLPTTSLHRVFAAFLALLGAWMLLQ